MVRLENEYFAEKQLIKRAEESIQKMQSLDVENMTQEQLEARERVIKSSKEEIKECQEILEEIKVELYDFIYNDGEVSKITIEALIDDLSIDVKNGELDDYDVEVLNGKQDFLKSLL